MRPNDEQTRPWGFRQDTAQAKTPAYRELPTGARCASTVSHALFVFKTAYPCPSQLKFSTVKDTQTVFGRLFSPSVRGNKNKCRMVGPQVSRTNTKRQKIKRRKRKGPFRSDFAANQNRADCYPIATPWTESQNTRAFGAANEGKRLLALPCLAPLLPPKPRRRWVWLRSKTAPGHAGIIL
jgi:hypothetical protein